MVSSFTKKWVILSGIITFVAISFDLAVSISIWDLTGSFSRVIEFMLPMFVSMTVCALFVGRFIKRFGNYFGLSLSFLLYALLCSVFVFADSLFFDYLV